MEEASISVHLVLSIAPNHLKILKRTIVWKSNQTRYSVSNTWPQLGRSWNLTVYWDSEVTSDHVTGMLLTIKSYNNSFMACWGNVCVCVLMCKIWPHSSLSTIDYWRYSSKTFLILQRHYAFWDPVILSCFEGSILIDQSRKSLMANLQKVSIISVHQISKEHKELWS